MPKLCLNMIVRNESARIIRCLESVIPYIDSYAIVDTGSSDNTCELIQNFMLEHTKPGLIAHVPFVNFEQARNAGLILAHGLSSAWNYLLLTDADMELVVEDKYFKEKLTASAYNLIQKAGTLSYANTRLIHKDNPGLYRGVTHEYLDCGPAAPLEGVWFRDHADGANRPDKFKRDIELLTKALDTEPNNERYWFYLGQSQRDAGDFVGAVGSYRKRVELGGWDEEVWNAQVNLAHSLNGLGDEAGFIKEMLVAYNMRPQRAETLYDLANHYRAKGQNAASTIFSEVGMTRKRPDDLLFVNDYVYSHGLREEFAITAFYDPAKRASGFEVCNSLALDPTASHHTREQARSNLFYYLPTLKDECPSFATQKVDFEPPAGWTAMNPSVAVLNNALYAVVRTVNYTMNEWGGYDINGAGGDISDTNPIETRNYLLRLAHDFKMIDASEIGMPLDRPNPVFKPVLGFEDMRLIAWRNELWASSCVREMNSDGWCEQVLGHLRKSDYGRYRYGCYRLDNWKKMLPEDRQNEKNWAPMVAGNDLQFMYRLGHTVDTHARTNAKTDTRLATDHISGGTQVIRIAPDTWLTLVHEARYLPGTQKRYYQHRFAVLSETGSLIKVGRPFVFEDRQIEFAAGLALQPVSKAAKPGDTRLVISYGVRDAEAKIATVSLQEVLRWIL